MCSTVRAGAHSRNALASATKPRVERVEEVDMTKSILRIVLTILMYAGVALFLFPYFTGRIMSGVPLMIIGVGCTVVCGFLRCYLTEGDCARIPHHGRDW